MKKTFLVLSVVAAMAFAGCDSTKSKVAAPVAAPVVVAPVAPKPVVAPAPAKSSLPGWKEVGFCVILGFVAGILFTRRNKELAEEALKLAEEAGKDIETGTKAVVTEAESLLHHTAATPVSGSK